MYTLDIERIYKGVAYRVVENLSSDNLLVVPKDKYDDKEFPIVPLIIPASDK